MSNDEIVYELTQIFSSMNAERNVEDALELQKSVAFFLDLGQEPVPFRDVKLDTYLYFIVMSEQLMLNLVRFDVAQWYVSLFNKFANGNVVKNSLLEIHIFNEVVINSRLGNRALALKQIDYWLDRPVSMKLRYRLLYKKGIIENAMQGSKGGINSLSKALACAEELDDELCVAQVYQEMAGMFGGRYPALGMSMIRKAENVYQRLGRNEDYIGTLLYRARSCIGVVNRYVEKHRPVEHFIEEANFIVDSIKEEDLPGEQLQAFYNWTKAMVKLKLEPIEKALSFYINAGAAGNVCHIAQHAVWTALVNGQKQRALNFLETYREYSQRINDGLSRDRIAFYNWYKGAIEDGLEVKKEGID